jgi:hypothetical protein
MRLVGRPRPSVRRHLVCLTLGAFAVSLSACGGSTATHTAAGDSPTPITPPASHLAGGGSTPSSSSGPHMSGQLVTFPLDGYEGTAAQNNSVSDAVGVLIKKCMALKGFRTPAFTQTPDSSSGFSEPYGITDLDQARIYGYGSPSNGSEALLGNHDVHLTRTKGGYTLGLGGSKAYRIAYDGYADGVPPGTNTVKGCEGAAFHQLYGGQTAPDSTDIVGKLEEEAEQQAEASTPVIEVVHRWSSCMSSAGFSYADPTQPFRQTWPQKPTEIEIRTAVADVQCKANDELPLIWQRAEASAQAQLVQKDSASLVAIQGRYRAVIGRAEAVLQAS